MNTKQIFLYDVSLSIIFCEKYDWSSYSLLKVKVNLEQLECLRSEDSPITHDWPF